METVFSQIGPWLFLLSLGSGMGVPLGIPPGPDDPVISRVAPEDCVFYTTWASAANPDARSKNQAEQMLAEPEVRLFIEHLEKWVRHAVNQAAPDREVNNLSDATFDTLLMVMRHQTAVFVSDVKLKGKRVSAKGGMVVALGADAKAVHRLFHQHARAFFVNLNAQSIETLSFHGDKWYRVKMTPDFPPLLVGIKDSYLVIVVGEETPDSVLRRMSGPVPAWLAKAQRLAAFERPTGLTYINLRRLHEASAASGDLQRHKLFETLGLTQAPWVMSASGLNGADVVTRTILPIEGPPQGILLPASGRGLRREDLASIPRDVSIALAARIDVQKTLDAVMPAAKKPDAEAKEPTLKVSDDPFNPSSEPAPALPPNIFRSLGDTWCFYNSPREGGIVVSGLTGSVPISDRKQFSKDYESLTRFVTQRLPPDDAAGAGGPRVRRSPFAGGDIHYTSLGEFGVSPAWWAGEKQLVFALAPQNVKAYLSRPAQGASLADVPEVAEELKGREPLLAVGYLDAPRMFETVYPLLMLAAPSYLGANGMLEGRRDMSVFPSLPSVCKHLRPGVAALRRTDLGLELTSRGSMPGFGLAAPVMFLAWDSEWLNLVFGESENNAPPVPAVVPGAPMAPVPIAPIPPPAGILPAPAK